MKRKTMALLLALSMCLSLLTACGSGNTATDDKPPESGNAASSTEQPEESEKLEKSAEPTQEEPKEEQPEKSPEPKPAVPAEMTYTFDAATGTLTCSGGGEITQEGWIKAVKNAIFETNGDKCKKEVKKVVIEDGVTAIASEAFRDTPVTEVIMPDSVTRIGSIAFGWTQITSIKISENATEIADGVFRQCENLSSVILPKNLTSIPIDMFDGCSSLTSIQIPEGVTEIGHGAFMGTGLTSITIPDGVTTIGYTAFMGCPITQITIPASVTHLENNWSAYCESLTDVTFLGDTDMDHVETWLWVPDDQSVTFHAPAGSVLEGYINRRISSGDVAWTFVPLS